MYGPPTLCHWLESNPLEAKENRKRNWHLLCISSRDILLLYLFIYFLIYDVGGALGEENCLLKPGSVKSACVDS